MSYSNELDKSQLLLEADRASSCWWYQASEQLLPYRDIKFDRSFSQTPEFSPQSQTVLRLLGIPQPDQLEPIPNSFFAEGLAIPATRRLFGLAQVSPTQNRLLGLNLTRGQHTADCMMITAYAFTHALLYNPEAFDQLTATYRVSLADSEFTEITDLSLARRVKTVMHFIEYMRLHDELTLPFQGGTHQIIDYDEDAALLSLLQSGITDPLTSAYYEKYGLDRMVIKQIAQDALNGSSTLAQVLKGKGQQGNILSIDTIASASRDVTTLASVLCGNTQPPDRTGLLTTFQRLNQLSLALETNQTYPYPLNPAIPFNIMRVIPQDLIRLQESQEQTVITYNYPDFVYRTTLTHIFLRLFNSGAPWVFGSDTDIAQDLQAVSRTIDATRTETELIDCLTDLGWVTQVTPDCLTTPSYRPIQISGWGYSEQGEGPQKKFRIKDTSATLVSSQEGTFTIKQLFPDLADVEKIVKDKPPLVLIKHP